MEDQEFREFMKKFNQVHLETLKLFNNSVSQIQTDIAVLQADVSDLKTDMVIVKDRVLNGWKPKQKKENS